MTTGEEEKAPAGSQEAAPAAEPTPAAEAAPVAAKVPEPPAAKAVAVATPRPKAKARRGASQSSIWALRRPLARRWRLPMMLFLPVLIGVVWCALTLGNPPFLGELFLPSPVRVLQVTLRTLFDGTLTDAIYASGVRIVLSFLAAAAVALPLGVWMGAYDPIYRLFEPIMAPLRYMPISAFIPLLILWFGIDEGQKIAFLFLGVFVYLLPVVVNAIRAVPDELVQTALTLGATRGQVIRTVLIPAALPDIFDSFRVMNAISWTYVILAEFVNARRGLGYLIALAGNHLKTAEVFSGILIIGMIGLSTDYAIRIVNGFLFRWRHER